MVGLDLFLKLYLRKQDRTERRSLSRNSAELIGLGRTADGEIEIRLYATIMKTMSAILL